MGSATGTIGTNICTRVVLCKLFNIYSYLSTISRVFGVVLLTITPRFYYFNPNANSKNSFSIGLNKLLVL